MRTRGWQLYVAVGLLLMAAAWLLPTLPAGSPRASRIICYELLSAAAVVAVVLGARWHRPPARLPWLLLAASQLVYFAADITYYTYHDALGDVSFPAPADALYLAHYPLLVTGLMLLLHHRSSGRDREGLLDALIITTGVGLLAWVYLLAPYIEITELEPLARTVSMAYPVMDVLVVAVAARLALSGGPRPPAYWLLLGSLVSLLIADSLYGLAQLEGTYEIGAPLDVGWLLLYVCLGAAALHPSMRALSEPAEVTDTARLSRTRLAALLAAALVAPAVLFVQTALGDPVDGRVIALAAAALFGLTMLRMRSMAGRVAAQSERERLLHRLGAIIDSSPVAIVELDRGGLVRLWNPAAERMYGWLSDDVLGRKHPAALEPGWPAPRPVDRGRGQAIANVALRQHRSDGTPIDVEMSTAPLRSPTGEPAGVMSVAVDVTERVRLAGQLRHQAFHDPLTNLANRALLQDRLEHALARMDRNGGLAAVLLLDVDAFKTVNDTLGHRIGDQLLSATADRLGGSLRPNDTVARFGGDEFVVLVEDVAGLDDGVDVAERLIAGLATPIHVAGRDIQVRVSIGIVLAGPGAQPDDVLRDADVAMYRAKADGGDSFRVFDPSMGAAVVERAALEDDLRHALERDELRLRYQPIVDLASGQIVGLEALVRWEHPTRGLLAPGSFIPLAEESGLIVAIGTWVLRRACEQTRHWQATIPGCEQLGISVNVSAVQLAQPDLADEVARILHITGFETRLLTLELTEHLLVTNIDTTGTALAELDAMGVLLAIDDFGTGYSSLSYLGNLPVDILKIDKAFVDDVATTPEAEALARAVVTLASTFGLATVAEGIECPEQIERLRELGCDRGQGYYFAKPLDDQQIATLLRSRQLAERASVPAS
jgi:diguanylate cyclase (GGDEF)-like protein/PAS domain S-box-containing protein